MTTVSIVIHNSPRQQLQTAIACLGVSSVNKIYILDNGNQGIDYSAVIEAYPIILYKKIKNNGFGAGHNIAIRQAIEEDPDGFHLVMNADVFWENDIISKLISYMEENQDVGIVAPKVFYPDGDLQYTCRMLPSPLDLFAKRFMPESLIEKRMIRYLLKEHNHDVPLNCPYLLGSFLFFRNKALLDCGIFDERFFMYPEDIDITRRIHEKWKTIYWPDVSIIHEHCAASRKDPLMLKIHIKNMIKYYNKWGWIIDKKRIKFNRELKNSLILQPSDQRPKGRG